MAVIGSHAPTARRTRVRADHRPPRRTPCRRRRPGWPRRRRGRPRPRSSTCRTGSTPTRSPRTRSTTPPPGSPRPSPATGSTSRRRPGSLATAVRAVKRGGRAGDGPRIGILAEYDALPGLGHGCGHNTMAASGVGAAIALAAIADELPGRDRLPRLPGRGAGEWQEADDRGRPVRGPRRRPPVPPVRPEPRLQLAARVGGRRRRLHRPPGARVVRSVDGQERARRDGPAVQLGRPVASAAPARRPASTGSSRRAARPPTSSRTAPGPGSCSAATERATTRR